MEGGGSDVSSPSGQEVTRSASIYVGQDSGDVDVQIPQVHGQRKQRISRMTWSQEAVEKLFCAVRAHFNLPKEASLPPPSALKMKDLFAIASSLGKDCTTESVRRVYRKKTDPR